MQSIQERFEEAKKVYDNLANLIEQLFDKWQPLVNFKFTKDELMAGYDYYIECYLIRIAIINKRATQTEMEYIQKLLRYRDYLGVDAKNVSHNNQLSSRNDLMNFANKGLSEVPIFAKLFAILDAVKAKESINNHLWMNDLLTKLQVLGQTLAGIDGDIDDEEEHTVYEYLYVIIDYMEKQDR